MTSLSNANVWSGVHPERIEVGAPVYEIDNAWYGSDNPFPTIFITERVFDEGGAFLGRAYSMVYPWEEVPDPDGDIVLSYGADYYREAMGYVDAENRETRIECFQAAEILYLHAAAKGSVLGHLNLGYVYAYDRCEGRYFVDHRHTESVEDYARPYPREQRAFECFSYAANSGDAEGCYKLGDMYRNGIGCELDQRKALAWYLKAFDMKGSAEPYVWGSVALRLGEAFENGIGCEPDLERALKWYRQAEVGLGICVSEGDAFYERRLASARSAAKRLAQELAGTY